MMNCVTTPVSVWLEKKFKDWRNDQPRGKDTITAFAAWLEVSRGSLNNWMLNDHIPEGISLIVLASKLGPEIYELAGAKPLKENLRIIVENWDRIPDDIQERIASDVQRAAQSGAAKPSDTGVGKSKRK